MKNLNKQGSMVMAAKWVSTLAMVLSGAVYPVLAYAVTDLADQPVFTSSAVPGNLLLTLSVEYPTAESIAYPPSFTPYSSSTGFIGYFDPGKCYDYYFDSSVALDNNSNQSFFYPVGLADSNHGCTATVANHPYLWSGSFLNWATMQTIDPFRWALTGGYRSTDAAIAGTGATTGAGTILEKAWGSGLGGSGETPNRSIPSSTSINSVTPFNWSGFSFRIWGLGNRMQFTNSASFSGSNGSTTGDTYRAGTTDNNNNYTPRTNNAYNPLSSQFSADYSGSGIYTVIVRTRVCDKVVGLETNCKQYTGTDGNALYKPEGLMQQYANQIRYGVFSYLNDSSILRDGGVLRANMKYIGPTQPNPGTTATTNSVAEWSSATGQMITNPNPTDASNTVTTDNGTISNSGAMNYVNKFGETSHTYKTYDPVSELYYAAIRYYKAFSSNPEVSTYSSSVNSTMADGFPVITGSNWQDPIIYACQKNFILGIGDVNTHADGNLPGSTSTNDNSTNEPLPAPPEVTSDTTIGNSTYSGTSKVTTYIGAFDGYTNLGNRSSGDDATYLIAGLAYDSHVKDMTPGKWTASNYLNADGTKKYIQTVSTFWVDVMEYQSYTSKNQYWYATKYGGFNLPSGTNTYTPYGTTGLTNSWWTNGNYVPTSATTVSSDLQPNNYYPAFQAQAMVSGLASAFQSIASQIKQTTTGFSLPNPTITSSSTMSYSANYDASTWTSDVIGSTITFDLAGNPTLNPVWHAQSLLQTQVASGGWNNGRVIATWSNGGAVAFRSGNLATADLAALDPGTALAAPNNVSNGTTQANYLNYLRGDSSNEVGSTTSGSKLAYRTRSSVLGDIVGSKVFVEGPPALTYSEANNPGYLSFKSNNASRATVIYVGANDGMLHAFAGSATGGNELFAYVPGALLQGPTGTPQTNGLAAYGKPSFVHHYYVNATPLVNDVDMARTNGSTTTGSWASLLVGGLGKGGKGYYAIDVTNPSTYAANNGNSNSSNESGLASAVKWEVNSSQAAYSTMGYSYGDPIIAKTAQYGWVVIVTSGYNNSDGNGYLYIINPTNGALLQKIQASDGTTISSNGMAYARAFTHDITDNTVESVYAGDLQGNLWRFDLTATTGNYPAPTRIAQLTDSSGNAQPITIPPTIVVQPNTLRRYILVGTGKLLGTTDVSSTKKQTMYAIVDGNNAGYYAASATGTNLNLPTGVSFPITRSQLTADTDLTAGIGSVPATSMGWYYDLNVNSTTRSAEVVNVPIAVNLDQAAFAANMPNGDVCTPSGSNRQFVINFATGKSVLLSGAGGSLVSSNSGSGLITDVSFTSVKLSNGATQTEVLFGSDNGNVTQGSLQASPQGAGSLLNWRTVPVNN